MSGFTRKKAGAAIAALAAIALSVTACSGEATPSASGSAPAAAAGKASGEISYWLWDNNQKPAYQQCADAFKVENPDATVKITQYAWDDYWSGVTNGFVAGTAPDVFTNHLSKYPEFVTQGQLVVPG